MTTYALMIALVLLAAVPARAQDTPLGDARWAPWLGCWRLVQDDRQAAATTSPEDILVCVLPASAGRGVGMTTYVGGQSVVQQTIVADGVSHPVSEPECSGSQRSEWSLTGQRLFTRAEITCSGQPTRTVSGIMLMAEGPTWVDIQAVGTDQDAQVRVRRYQRTSSPPEGVVLPADLQERAVAATVRVAGPTSMTLEDVIDASGKIAAPAVEAALLETGSRFALNSRALRELDAADVPDGVVNVMVASPFPDHFMVDRPLRGRATQTSSPYYPYYAYNPYAHRSYYPYFFYYSPFGYSNWWGNLDHPHYSSGPRPVVVVPGGLVRPGGGGPNWWGNRYSSGPRPVVVVPGGLARPGGGGPNWWGNRYSSSPRPVVVVPGGLARPGGSEPNWWGNRYSSGSTSSAGSNSGGGSASSPGTRSSGSGSDSGGSDSRSGRTAQPR